MSDTMQERAAKVADEYADFCNLGEPTEGAARQIAQFIRGLPTSPDPTRAALEECVRAMEPLVRYAVLNDIHERPDGALEIPNAALMNLRVAYRNARALQGE